MKILDDEREELVRDIRKMKGGNFNQIYLVSKYALVSYFNSLRVFGRKNELTKDNLRVVREMLEVLKTERVLLNYILDNIDEFDATAIGEVIDLLDECNDNTINYYYRIIDSIEDACWMNDSFRGIRPKLDGGTVNSDNSYVSEVIALGEDIDSLKNFLDYEDEFWNFVDDRIRWVNTNIEISRKIVHVFPIKDKNDIIVNMDILVPKIINLETALMAMKIFRKAYVIYKNIGNNIDNLLYSDGEEVMDKYRNVYLPDKAKKKLELKYVK